MSVISHYFADGDYLQFLSDILNKLPEYRSLSSAVNLSHHLAATGLSGVHKAHVAFALASQKGKKAIIIAPDEQEAMKFVTDLGTFFGGGVYFYPSRDFTFRQVESVSHEFEHERLRILGRMAQGDYNAVVTCADAAMQLTIPMAQYCGRTVDVKKGQEMPPDYVVTSLIKAGYTRAAQVDGMGQFAVRGGIIDFFPPHTDNPVRIEFWGDEPDTISFFDIETQRRTGEIESVLITPAAEVLFDSPESLAAKIEKIKNDLKSKTAAKAITLLEHDIDRLKGKASLATNDKYLPVCYDGKPASFSIMQKARSCLSANRTVLRSASKIPTGNTARISSHFLRTECSARVWIGFILKKKSSNPNLRSGAPFILTPLSVPLMKPMCET